MSVLKSLLHVHVNWEDAVAHITIHSRLEYHLSSEAKRDAFLRTMQHPSERIDMSLSTAK